jgi:DNA-binding SARP family transcriptional activator
LSILFAASACPVRFWGVALASVPLTAVAAATGRLLHKRSHGSEAAGSRIAAKTERPGSSGLHRAETRDGVLGHQGGALRSVAILEGSSGMRVWVASGPPRCEELGSLLSSCPSFPVALESPAADPVRRAVGDICPYMLQVGDHGEGRLFLNMGIVRRVCFWADIEDVRSQVLHSVLRPFLDAWDQDRVVILSPAKDMKDGSSVGKRSKGNRARGVLLAAVREGRRGWTPRACSFLKGLGSSEDLAIAVSPRPIRGFLNVELGKTLRIGKGVMMPAEGCEAPLAESRGHASASSRVPAGTSWLREDWGSAVLSRSSPEPASCGDDEPEGPEVVVRVLGEPVIEGVARSQWRKKCLEAAIYLALHPEGVAKRTWVRAMWPNREVSRDAVNTFLWLLRRTLGEGADGHEYLPAPGLGPLRLSHRVAVDLFLAESLARSRNREDLVVVLEMVRGRPFEGLHDCVWLIEEGHLARAEQVVSEAAVELAEASFDMDDPATAMWAARRGLLACPYDERLWRVAMRAAKATTGVAGVEAVKRQLDRVVVEQLGMSGATEETVRLYQALRRN